MPDTTNVTIENNTPEEVAYKLAKTILGVGKKPKEELLACYERCLKVVRGTPYKNLDQ